MLAGDLDFGDAPDIDSGTGPGNYATLAEHGGPSHVVSSALRIGTSSDPEDVARPNLNADGDDFEPGIADDEDGVRNPSLDLSFTVTSSPAVSVIVNNITGKAATLYGWVDFNGDGTFDNTTERASAQVGGDQAEKGFFIQEAVELQFPQLLTSFHGTTYARFRLGFSDDAAAANPTGAAGIGEVEDYEAQIHRPSTRNVEELRYYQTPALYEDGRNDFTQPFVSGKYSVSYGFGSSVVSVGDLDDNGVNDLAVGVPSASMNGVDNGAIHIFFMEADGSYSKRTIIAPDAGFGTSTENGGNWLRLASLGDLDGDGINELAVSYGAAQPISLRDLPKLRWYGGNRHAYRNWCRNPGRLSW